MKMVNYERGKGTSFEFDEDDIKGTISTVDVKADTPPIAKPNSDQDAALTNAGVESKTSETVPLTKPNQRADSKASVTTGIIDSSYNPILDDDMDYQIVDLLKHVPNDHILKKLSIDVSAVVQMPINTVFLNGLGIVSQMASKKWKVVYENGHHLPLGLYILTEQPSGAGKGWAHSSFTKPFYTIFHEALEKLKEHNAKIKKDEPKAIIPSLFDSNVTQEALDRILELSGGHFALLSTEQGLVNVLFGDCYGDKSKKQNNDTTLFGFEGGYASSNRITRTGYKGFVYGGITCFAQEGTISSVINSSNGTGSAERFLYLVEKHRLGCREFIEPRRHNQRLLDAYANHCQFAKGTIPNQCDFNDLEVLRLSPSGYRLIRNMQQEIEPRLIDKGDLSHDMLRGFAGKMNMQVMKIASLLHVFSPNRKDSVINDIYVKAAINIVTELLEATRSMLKA